MAIILRDSSPETHPLSYNRTFARGRARWRDSVSSTPNEPALPRPYSQDKPYESERARPTTSGQQELSKKRSEKTSEQKKKQKKSESKKKIHRKLNRMYMTKSEECI